MDQRILRKHGIKLEDIVIGKKPTSPSEQQSIHSETEKKDDKSLDKILFAEESEKSTPLASMMDIDQPSPKPSIQPDISEQQLTTTQVRMIVDEESFDSTRAHVNDGSQYKME
jgi:hypothetical protein